MYDNMLNCCCRNTEVKEDREKVDEDRLQTMMMTTTIVLMMTMMMMMMMMM